MAQGQWGKSRVRRENYFYIAHVRCANSQELQEAMDIMPPGLHLLLFIRHKPPTTCLPTLNSLSWHLAIRAAAPKSVAQRGVVVRQIQHALTQTCSLDDAPHFHGTFIFYQSADGVE